MMEGMTNTRRKICEPQNVVLIGKLTVNKSASGMMLPLA